MGLPADSGGNGDEMITEEGSCGAWQRVPEEIAIRLDDVPGAAYEVPSEVTCALQQGHPDNHMAVLQGWGNEEVWLSWSAPRTITAPGCRAEGMTCLLPTGHQGHHYVIMADVVEDEGPYWVADRADLDTRRAGVPGG
ncbi:MULTISPECIES: hypothetical protein [Parafrankia]|nr:MULTISPECIES: hypothetical protein [Parafrankia]